MRTHALSIKFAVGAVALATLAFSLPVFAFGTVIVSPGNQQGWGFAQETPTGSGQFVTGPSGGLGAGSVELTVDSTGGEIFGVAGYGATPLSDITELKYSTYRSLGGAALAIALQLNFDADITDVNNVWQGRLVYEPYHTNVVSTGVWQNWDTLNDTQGTGTGNWWFSNGALAAASTCTMATPCTWAEVMSAFPDGGIHPTLGAVIFKAGGGWTGGFTGNVDGLVLGIDGDSTTFNFEIDGDNDGIPDGVDKCVAPAISDSFELFGQAKGRYQWNGTAWVSAGKGDKNFTPSMEYTYGCTGKQILNAMTEATGEDFSGHYKFGVTKSILEAWHEGRYYMGEQLRETVTVPAVDADGVQSITALDADTEYFLRAYGTAEAGDGITFDADYSIRPVSSSEWTDAVSTYESYGDTLLDLQVNGMSLDWGPYSPTNDYKIPYMGVGALTFRVNDVYHVNNTGDLFVDIIENVWVDLW